MNKNQSAKTVLVIDDDRDQRRTMGGILADQGYDIHTASSAREALQLARDHDAAVAVIDIRLNGASGVDVLRELKKLHPDLECILITAHASQKSAIEAINLGAFSYLQKPLSAERLRLTVQRAVEKHASGRELAALKTFHENIVQNMSEGIAVVDDKARFTFLNRAACELLGYAREDLIGKRWTRVVPADQRVLMERKISRREQGSGGHYEIEFTRKGGERIHALASATPRYTAEKNGETLIVFADITDHVRYEERMNIQGAALEAAANAVLITDREGKIEQVNPAFTKLTGFTLDEVEGKNPRILKSGEMSDSFYAEMWRTISSGEPWQGKIINKKRDGTLYIEEQTITPVTGPGGEISHYIAIKNDVTNEARAKHALKRQLEELKVLNKIAAAGTAMISEDELISEAVKILAESIYPAHVEVLLLDEERGELVTHPSYHGAIIEEDLLTIPVGQGIVGRVAQEGVPRRLGDVTEADDYIAVNPDMRSELCVPIKGREKVHGVINVENRHVDDFNSSDERLLTTYASQLATALEKIRLLNEVQSRVDQLEALRRIDTTISSSLDIDLMLKVLLNEARTQLNVDAADVLLYNAGAKQLEYAAQSGFLSGSVEGIIIQMGEGYAGRAVTDRELVHFPDLSYLDPNKTQPLSFVSLEGFRGYAAMPLIAKGTIKGVLEVYHRAPLERSPGWFDFLKTLATQAAIAIDHMDLFRELQKSNMELRESYGKTLEGWARALELRDHETGGHSDRVLNMTLQLAEKMGVHQDQMEHIRRGTLLHDIGKMGIPDRILRKPGPLTDSEWKLMEKHPRYARDLLSDIPYLKPALDIPYSHHEKWDGSGYPNGLEGEEIPVSARIFAVVDVWDALLSDRPYRDAWKWDKAVAYIKEQRGKHFDPDVVDNFLEIVQGKSS